MRETMVVECRPWQLKLSESGPKIKHEWAVVGATKWENMALDHMPKNEGQRQWAMAVTSHDFLANQLNGQQLFNSRRSEDVLL